jgi:hypothetical protein
VPAVWKIYEPKAREFLCMYDAAKAFDAEPTAKIYPAAPAKPA